jgi:hypothetical protein
VSMLRLALIFPCLTQTDTTWHYVDNIIWMWVTPTLHLALLM